MISLKHAKPFSSPSRVDTRVMQVLYALPSKTVGFWRGQQVDVFIEG